VQLGRQRYRAALAQRVTKAAKSEYKSDLDHACFQCMVAQPNIDGGATPPVGPCLAGGDSQGSGSDSYPCPTEFEACLGDTDCSAILGDSWRFLEILGDGSSRPDEATCAANTLAVRVRDGMRGRCRCPSSTSASGRIHGAAL
jgi:hypothetical protein